MRLSVTLKNSSEDQRRRNYQATAKVFGTPELLEQILMSGLTTRDLLSTMQISRVFRDRVLGSNQLLRFMGLLPGQSGSTYSGFTRSGAFNEFYSFRTSLNSSLHYGTTKIVAFFERSITLPALGSRCRSMRICHPPILEMTMQSDCCTQEWLLKCPNGVTVGCIYDETQRIQQTHRLCPFALPGNHNADGTVKVYVRFSGTIEWPKDDYVAERNRRTLARVDSTLWSLDVNSYITAKKDGMYRLAQVDLVVH